MGILADCRSEKHRKNAVFPRFWGFKQICLKWPKMPLFSKKAVQNAFFRKNTSHARSSAFCLGIFCKKSVFDKRVPPKNDHFRSFSGYPQKEVKIAIFRYFCSFSIVETLLRLALDAIESQEVVWPAVGKNTHTDLDMYSMRASTYRPRLNTICYNTTKFYSLLILHRI